MTAAPAGHSLFDGSLFKKCYFPTINKLEKSQAVHVMFALVRSNSTPDALSAVMFFSQFNMLY